MAEQPSPMPRIRRLYGTGLGLKGKDFVVVGD